jgi:hypothetical protein
LIIAATIAKISYLLSSLTVPKNLASGRNETRKILQSVLGSVSPILPTEILLIFTTKMVLSQW